MFLLAFRLALLASTNLVECDPEDASAALRRRRGNGCEFSGGFSGVETRTCGCDWVRSLLLPLLLAALAAVLTAAVVVA